VTAVGGVLRRPEPLPSQAGSTGSNRLMMWEVDGVGTAHRVRTRACEPQKKGKALLVEAARRDVVGPHVAGRDAARVNCWRLAQGWVEGDVGVPALSLCTERVAAPSMRAAVARRRSTRSTTRAEMRRSATTA
jgi:hypothetical protein